MTTRIKGLMVTLEMDIRVDDAESIKNAIMMIKGISSVADIDANPSDWVTESRIKSDLRDKLYNFINKEL